MEVTTVTIVGPTREVDVELPATAPVASWLATAIELVEPGALEDAVAPVVRWSLRPLGGGAIPAGESLAGAGVLDGARLLLEPGEPAAPEVRARRPEPAPPAPPRPAEIGPAAITYVLMTGAAVVLGALVYALLLLHLDPLVLPTLSGEIALTGLLVATCLPLPGWLAEVIALPVPAFTGLAVVEGIGDRTGSTTALILCGIAAAVAVATGLSVLGPARISLGTAVAGALLGVIVAADALGTWISLTYLDAVLCAILVAGVASVDRLAAIAGRVLGWTGSDLAVLPVRRGVAIWLAVVLGAGLTALVLSPDPLAAGGAAAIGVVLLREALRRPRVDEGIGLLLAGALAVIGAPAVWTLRLGIERNVGGTLALALGTAIAFLVLTGTVRRAPQRAIAPWSAEGQ